LGTVEVVVVDGVEVAEFRREAPSFDAERLEDAEDDRREEEVTVLEAAGAPFPRGLARPIIGGEEGDGDDGADDFADDGLSHEEKKSSSLTSALASAEEVMSGIPST
jgi:hypothetical protein